MTIRKIPATDQTALTRPLSTAQKGWRSGHAHETSGAGSAVAAMKRKREARLLVLKEPVDEHRNGTETDLLLVKEPIGIMKNKFERKGGQRQTDMGTTSKTRTYESRREETATQVVEKAKIGFDQVVKR